VGVVRLPAFAFTLRLPHFGRILLDELLSHRIEVLPQAGIAGIAKVLSAFL
jgi:hypothetical protein